MPASSLEQEEAPLSPSETGRQYDLPDAIVELERTYEAGVFCNGTDGCHTELETVRFWHYLVLLTQSRMILETGTYRGYSACYLASALKKLGGGKLFTIDPWNIPHFWDDSDLAEFIQWIPTRSNEALGHVKDVTFDLIFFDSEHTYRTCMQEVILFEPLLRTGGYLVFHDTLLHDGPGAVVEQLQRSRRFEVVTMETPRRYSQFGGVSCGTTIARKITEGYGDLPYHRDRATWEERLPPAYGVPWVRRASLVAYLESTRLPRYFTLRHLWRTFKRRIRKITSPRQP